MQRAKSEWIREVKLLQKQLGRKPKKRDSNRLYNLSRKLFGSWNKAMESAGHEVHYYQKAKVPDLDGNLAYYLGLLVTDGHIVKSKSKSYNLEIYTSYEEERDVLVELIKELFDYNAFVWSRRTQWSKRTNYIVRVFSKELVEHLIRNFGLPPGNKARIVEVPTGMMAAPADLQGAFLRGVIDGDGCIKVSPPYMAISAASTCFLAQIQGMLEMRGITTNNIYQQKDRELYVLGVSGRKNIYKLYKLMYPPGSDYSYPRKQREFEKISFPV